MTKRMLLATIISLILVIFLTVVFLSFENFTIVYFSSIALIIFLYLLLLRKEREAFNKIIIDYTVKIDNDKYIKELEKYQRRFFQTKKVKTLYGIYIAGAYVDAGRFDEAINELKFIEDNQKYLDAATMVIYLKIWSDFYYYNFDSEKMKMIIDMIKDILDKNENKKNDFTFNQIYNYQEAKYYSLAGINLNQSLNAFENRKKTLPQVGLPLFSITYQIAFTYLRMKNYNESYRLFKNIADSSVAKSKSRIFVVNKSVEFYNKLKELLHKDENI